nr:hypothetical protein CFP56_72584 [Quercus suber]
MDFKSLNHGGISEILSRTRQASSSLSISSSTRDKLLLLLFLSGGNTVQKNAKAGAYINIVIDNWEDIKILCGRDRATGIGVEHMVDVVEVMAEEGENELLSLYFPLRLDSGDVYDYVACFVRRSMDFKALFLNG